MFSFDKTHRLLHKQAYDDVFAQANKTSSSEFVVLHRKNALGHPRLGLAISKKVVAKSYQRNRLKRLIRESFRTHTLPAIDIIFLARRGVVQTDNAVILRNLRKTWEKLVTYYEN